MKGTDFMQGLYIVFYYWKCIMRYIWLCNTVNEYLINLPLETTPNNVSLTKVGSVYER